MKRPESPCLGCKDREAGCHSMCVAYDSYVKAQKEYRERISAQKIEENRLNEIEVNRFKK